MDLINELSLMKSDGIDSSISYVKSQKEIWEKKLHIFNVINLVNGLEHLVQEGYFERNNVTHLRIYSSMHYTGNHIKYQMWSKDHNPFILKDENGQELINGDLENLFYEFDGFRTKNIKENFELFLSVKGDVREQLLDKLLSEDLKKVLEYSEMQVEVGQKNESKNKKPKI